jgi:hypothetical protein
VHCSRPTPSYTVRRDEEVVPMASRDVCHDTKIEFRLPRELLAEIELTAEAEGRTLSDVIRRDLVECSSKRAMARGHMAAAA